MDPRIRRRQVREAVQRWRDKKKAVSVDQEPAYILGPSHSELSQAYVAKFGEPLPDWAAPSKDEPVIPDYSIDERIENIHLAEMESRTPKQPQPPADPVVETTKAAERLGCSPADVEWWHWERDSRDFYVPVVVEFDPAEYAARGLYPRVKSEPPQPAAKPAPNGEQVQLGVPNWGSLGNHVS